MVFEFRGRVVGIDTSPDSRFLYVNYLPWPRNYESSRERGSDNIADPPVCGDVHCAVINLVNFEVVGRFGKRPEVFKVRHFSITIRATNA